MAAMTGREALLGAVGAATYWGALQIAPPDYTKPLTDAGLIVLGVWLGLVVLQVVVDLVERVRSSRGVTTDNGENSTGPMAERPPSESD